MKREEYYQERDSKILTDIDAGMTWSEAAAKYSMTRDAIRHVCNKAGKNDPRYNKTKKQQEIEKQTALILQLRSAGKSYQEILPETSYKSLSAVISVCKKAGLDKKWDFGQTAIPIREDRIKGLSFNEIAEKYHVGYATVAKACKGMPEPENIKEIRSRGIIRSAQRSVGAATEKYIEFLQSSGFTNIRREKHDHNNNDNFYAVCNECGAQIKKARTTLQHMIADGRKLQCDNCSRLTVKASKLEANLKAKFRKHDEQILRIISAKARKVKHDMRLHPCPVCGEMTINKKYCSVKCQNKAQWAAKDAKRRAKIEAALVDKDISLRKLYKRDHGVCHICGGLCDYNDHETKNGVFLVGYKYPSIDHVVPLARGGKHSWDNVKLAHWYCNTLKSDSVSA